MRTCGNKSGRLRAAVRIALTICDGEPKLRRCIERDLAERPARVCRIPVLVALLFECERGVGREAVPAAIKCTTVGTEIVRELARNGTLAKEKF